MDTPGKRPGSRKNVVAIDCPPSTGKRKLRREKRDDSTPATSINYLNLVGDDDDAPILVSNRSSKSRSTKCSKTVTSSYVDLVEDDEDDAAFARRLQREEDELHSRDRRREEEESTLRFLQQESALRQESLQQLRYSCQICLASDIALEDMVSLSCQPVGHKYCSDCFSGYCGSKISEAQVDAASLVCPAVGCATPITPVPSATMLPLCHTCMTLIDLL